MLLDIIRPYKVGPNKSIKLDGVKKTWICGAYCYWIRHISNKWL